MNVMTENAPTLPSAPHVVESCMQVRFSSRRELLPGICQAAVALATGSTSGVSPKLALVLAELVANAIEHGNQNEPTRMVEICIQRLGAKTLEIAVSDEGAGFDRDALDLRPLSTPADSQNKGLRLVNALCDTLEIQNCGRRIVCRLSWETDLGMTAYTRRTQDPTTTKE